MLFSIVIPSLLQAPSLKSLILSCAAQKIDQEYEIIIVHPLGAESSQKLPMSSYIKWISIPEKNVSLARNRGRAEAKGRYILFLDDDVILPEENFLDSLWNRFQKLPQGSVFGGGYLNPSPASVIQQAGNKLANMWIQSGLRQPLISQSNVFSCQFLVGGILFSEKSSFEKTPFFDSIAWGGEDTAFSYSAAKNGFHLFYSYENDVIHQGSSSFFKFIRRSWLSGKVQSLIPYRSASLKKRLSLLGQIARPNSLNLWPLVALHFLTLNISKVFYQTRQDSPRDMRK